MRQYQKIKAKYPETILLFRMGDFFETFEEDAKITSKVLGITLTKRGDGAAAEVPLAGFPHHALDTYLPKLLKAGYRVAVCEQLEDPKLAKGIVKRDVIEVVTPGIAFSDKVLDQKQNNYLACVALPSPLATSEDLIGFSFVDVSTGEFATSEFPLKMLKEQVALISPAEILVQKRDYQTVMELLRGQFDRTYTKAEDWTFNFDFGYEILVNHFQTQSLKGFGCEDYKLGVVAAGAVLNYLQETQKANLPHLKKITPYDVSEYMFLPPSTQRNLEILSPLMESGRFGTLFSVLDQTQTPMGARLLKKWILQPLKKVEPIRSRLDAVRELVEKTPVRKKLREVLLNIGDLERLIARIATGRANPREMIGLKVILSYIPHLKLHLGACTSRELSSLRDNLEPLQQLVQEISDAIVDDPPLNLADGGVIRRGYNQELDELRDVAFSGKEWIAHLQQKERSRTGIPSLKVGFNNVFGYYIEVTHTHKNKIPPDYLRKQTLVNAERYITPELKEYEEKILHAEERILILESDLFHELRKRAAECAAVIQRNAEIIATLDCFSSLSDVAVEYDYCCPEIDESTRIDIRAGRHPVIERLLPPGERYIPNDCTVDTSENQILIITGPNMSGKSSYLRQVGLIVLMAQMGSFVPAESARIGLVDRIYTRVGAMDSIATGESTFLVEMNEAAQIVNTATPRSLILLDEVGRGTSTFDGISIAWALTEYLHQRTGARTLFATHYHELNELAELFPRIKNLKVEVREYGDKVLFLHKVNPGFADHSYGIQVAQMAGLPEEITERAKRILKNLEGSELTVHAEEDSGSGIADRERKGEKRAKGRIVPAEVQLTLFEMRDDQLREEIKKLDLEKMTPLEALQKLAELKKRVEKS